MKLIVGLGNPGLIYENTRHNLGAWVLKAIAREYKVRLKLDRSLKSRVAKIDILGTQCLIAIPNTFMNLSGEVINPLLRIKKILLKDLLVIYDDIDLELGAIRFRKKGSSGGHKGIKSIIMALGTEGFNRLKLGVGKSSCKEDTKDYVLSSFSKKELKIVNSLIERVVKACEMWVRFGLDRAMNEFN